MSLGQLGLQSFISKFGSDVVALYAQDDSGIPGQPIVTNANIMKASINTRSRIFSHPLANGTVLSDHVIDEPVDIELALIITNKNTSFSEFEIGFNAPSQSVLRNTYSTLLAYQQSRRLLALQTRANLFTNLLIYALPHQETVDVFNGIVLIVKLQETRFAIPIVGVFSPINEVQVDTKDRGVIQSTPPTQTQQSAAAALLDNLTGSLSGYFNE